MRWCGIRGEGPALCSSFVRLKSQVSHPTGRCKHWWFLQTRLLTKISNMRCFKLFATVWALLNESSQAKDHQPVKWLSGGLWGCAIAHRVQKELKKIKAHQVAPRSYLAFVGASHRRNGKPDVVPRTTTYGSSTRFQLYRRPLYHKRVL